MENMKICNVYKDRRTEKEHEPIDEAYKEKHFLNLADTMEKEQECNPNCIQEIAVLISEEEHPEGDVQMFMGVRIVYNFVGRLNRLINKDFWR